MSMGVITTVFISRFSTVEVKSAEEKDKEKFLQVIRETLEKLVKEGIDQKAIDCRYQLFGIPFP